MARNANYYFIFKKRVKNIEFDIQNRALKASIDTKKLIFGTFANAKEGF